MWNFWQESTADYFSAIFCCTTKSMSRSRHDTLTLSNISKPQVWKNVSTIHNNVRAVAKYFLPIVQTELMEKNSAKLHDYRSWRAKVPSSFQTDPKEQLVAILWNFLWKTKASKIKMNCFLNNSFAGIKIWISCLKNCFGDQKRVENLTNFQYSKFEKTLKYFRRIFRWISSETLDGTFESVVRS